MAQNYDFNFYRADRIDFSIAVLNVDASGVETPKLDVSTYLVELAVKEDYLSTSNSLLFSSSYGGIEVTDNIIHCTKSSLELANIPAKQYRYDLQLKDASLDNFTYMYGLWNLSDDITRP